MRTIKFRIWDDQLEKMIIMPEITSFRSDHLPSIEGIPVDYTITSGIVEKTIQENSKYTNICNDMPIMQFTGLKDKNGKEIYEGDIVKADGVTRIIEFRDGAFVINNSFPSFTIPTGTIKIEVIGNIYENKELLK